MKKFFTFCNLLFQKRLLGLFFLLLLCNNALGQTFCRPVSNTNSISGLCIGSSITNPTAAYDNDAGLTTFTTLSTVVGVFCSAQETLVLNQTARAGDQIVVYMGNGAGLLNLSLLSTGTIQPKLNGNNAGTALAINNPLLNLAILPGNTVGVLRYTLTGDANQVQIQLGGVVSALTDLRIYDVRLEFAAPTVTDGLNHTICSGNSATLTAAPAAGTTVAWYSSPTAATALATTNSYTTPALTANTTYYIGVTRAAACEGNERIPVVVNVSNPVVPAISTVGTAICSTGTTQQTTLSVINPIPGTTYNWYDVALGGAALASGTSYSPTVPLGTSSFYVEAAIGSCLSTRTQVDVISNAVPAAPTVLTQSVTIQSGQNATLNATTSQVGVTLNWYDVANGGTALAINTATYTTPVLTATKTFYVEAQSAAGSCVNTARVAVPVTVIPSALGGCLEAGSQQTLQNGLCLFCSSTNPNNSVDGNPATFARLTVPIGLINGFVQQTLQFNNPGKAGDIVDVELELPGGLADVQLLGAISLATYNGATYNNDRTLINNSLITLQLLSGNRFKASVVAGANFDRVEIRLGGLATLLTSVDIYQATYRYKVPTIAGNAPICSGQTATLVANIAVGETINWYNVATGGASLASTVSYTTTALTTPTTYYAEIARNGCVNSERFPVLVPVNNPVAPVIAATGTTICSGQTTTLNVQAPVAGTVYNWYDAGGNLLFTGNSFATPNLTANTTYSVEAGIGSCTSETRTSVTVTVNPLPAAPIAASSNVVIQSGQTAALQVSSPDSNITFDWYNVATNGVALATGTNAYTTASLTANQTYYVAARNITSGCISSTRTAINVIISNTVSTCLQVNDQDTTKGGGITGCLLCSSSNDGNSADGNPATAASLSVPLGIVGDYIQQMLKFSTAGHAGDIIDVELGIPAGIINVNALSYISLRSYNGGTPNSDQVNVGSLVNIQLLSSTRLKASFVAGGPFTDVEVRLGGLATLLTSLDIYGASYRYGNATVTGAASPICNQQTATLTASSTVSGETFTWHDAASGGTELSPTATYTTPNLTATTTYYLEATRDGTCTNSVRQPVTVTVAPFATAADVTIASPQEASCAGGAVLSPTSPLAGAQFKYYTDQNKTQEIITGSTVVAQPGVSFSKDATTGALTISGLSASGAPYNYYVSVVNSVTCENDINTLKPVVVNFPTVTPLAVIGTPLTGCGTVNLADAIPGFDTSGSTTYTFYDPSNNILPANAASNINTSGVYSIQAQGNGVTCPSVKLPVTVTINPLPSLIVPASISVNTGSTVALNAISDGTVAWFDPQGNAITGPPFTTGTLNTPGVYTYTVVATSTLGCSVTGTVSINVISPNTCQSLTERVYATAQTSGSIITGGVTNGGNAVDGNPQTFSTITAELGLLGIGTTWQTLTWPANIVKGTPVTIKLGSEYSAVAVGHNLSVVGTKNGVDIGTLQSVSGSLLNLLSGENSFEYTFVPADGTGPQDYDGVRIQLGSLLSVAQNAKVFDAYYNISVPTVTCTPGDIQDVYYGATDLGLPIGALTATVGVSNAWNVADNDITTFATMYSGVGALAAADLTVAFKTPAIASDTLRIVVSKPGVLLDVNLLTGFTIQRYLGNVAVGAPIQNTSTLLSIRLLPGNTMSMVLVSSQPEPYDRIRIRFGGVAGVLEFLRVHTVERVGNTKVIGGDLNNKVTVCPGSPVTLVIPTDDCSTYTWYDSPIGGSVVATGVTYTVPNTLAAGIYKYYVQPVRYGCETFARGEVTVEVSGSTPEDALTEITLNGAATTSICSPTGTVTLATTVVSTVTLTNPIYYWYSFDGTTSQLIPGETTPQLVVTGLVPGTYTYYVGVSSDEYCQTAEADRKHITFTILPPSNETDILVDDVIVCHDVAAVLTPTASTLTNPVFTWYLDNAKTLPITNGAVISGATYAISTAGVLTVTSLTRAVSPITYYVGVSSDTTCENIAGTLQPASVIVNDPLTPTTTDDTQDFCLVNLPTVANIQVNEPNVVWYNVATGGTAIPPTTALISDIYYGAALDLATGCESSVRLPITINVSDPGTPTTTLLTQNFCLVNKPTVANIQVNETGVIWYDAATGGAVIPSTTALTSRIYYGALVNGLGCESAVRLAVTITVTDPLTPTTTDSEQDFCLVNKPTVANIQVNETGVIWYNADTGGTAIPATTALANGLYYGAILNPLTGCESSIRLIVSVTINDPGTPTTVSLTQNFCLVNKPTVANIQVNETGVIWYNTETGGTAIAPATALTTGIYYGALVDGLGCESAVRLAVTINVNDPGTPTTTSLTQNFCLVNKPIVANIQVNETGVIWYNAAQGGTAIPATTALTNGIYYGALVDGLGCESAVRLAVTITVTDPLTPTTTNSEQNFCLVNKPTVANIQVNETGVIWYNADTGGTAIPATTALTNGLYYGAILNPLTGCESSIRLAVSVTVNDPGTPTTVSLNQNFCLVNLPTVANIQVNQTGVIWYNADTGGTAIPATTALISGVYYGAIIDGLGCESAVRLAVTITVSDPATPSTANTAQSFCITNAPTVANIQVNEPNVIWYNAAQGGTAIPATTPLVNGIYYGARVDGSGCESSSRLLVTVTIENPTATPTTTSLTQNFCSINAPTVANIQVNEANVVWYSTAIGGTAIPATTALATGIYHGAISSTIGCENPIRLAVTVNVNTPGVVTTTDTTQEFCLSAAPTVANIQVNQPNVVWFSTANGGIALAPNTPLTATTYYATTLSNTTNGCDNATRLAIAVSFINDAMYPINTSDNTPCVFQGITYSVANGKSNYVWSITSGTGTIIAGGGNADGSATISWGDVGSGTVSVTYINTCDETTTKTLNVTVATCSDLTITNTVSNPTPNFGDEIVFTVTVNNVGEGVIKNVIVSDLIPSGYELVSTSTSTGVYDPLTGLWTIPNLNAAESETLEIRVIVMPNGEYTNVASIENSTPLDVDPTNNTASALVEPICLTVYNEFTPNSDGANDLFRIDCIESYPNNELKVYNRYGSLVYSKKGYENDWDGTANVSGVINRGDMLPTGTYFYVIDIGDGTVKKGWLSIMR